MSPLLPIPGHSARLRRAFTLIELLTVMVIASILLVVTLPAFSSVLSSVALTAGCNQVLGTLTLARQDAITYNHNVAVYFFKYTSPDSNSAATYSGVQAWQLNLSSTGTGSLVATQPVTRFSALGSRIVLNDNFSTILNPTLNVNGSSTSSTPSAPVPPTLPPAVGPVPTYMAVVFHPDGSTSLPLTATSDSGTAGTFYWSVTACNASDYRKSPTTLPADFATVQIDASEGTCRLLRP